MALAWQPTAAVADACVRVGAPAPVAPAGLRPLERDGRLARPVRHPGSVDVFLEAIEAAAAGDSLAIDNHGRRDEACIGDLVAVEAQAAGLTGVVVWGCHRDSAKLRRLGSPVSSYGATPPGPIRTPMRADALSASIDFAGVPVGLGDVVFADEDGAVFVEKEWVKPVLEAAEEIRRVEAAQPAAVLEGTSLRRQLELDRYVAERRRDARLTFRAHLRRLGRAMEE